MSIGNGHDPVVSFEPLRGKRRIEIEQCLDAHFDADEGRYKSGISDQWMANSCSASLQQIEEIRTARYGELRPDRSMEEWKKEHESLVGEIEQSRAKLNAQVAELDESLKAHQELNAGCFVKLEAIIKEAKETLRQINMDQERITSLKKAIHRLRDDCNDKCNIRIEQHRVATVRGPSRRAR